jgi:hypothetical protein
MRGCKKILLTLGFAPLVAFAAEPVVTAPDTGVTASLANTNSGRHLDSSARDRLEKDLNRPTPLNFNPGDNYPSLRPNLATPRLSAEQLEKIKNRLDEQRNWMLADPNADASTNASAASAEHELARKTFGVSTASATEKYFNREASARAAASSNAAQTDLNSRSEISEKISFTKTLFGLDNAAAGHEASSEAISSIARLFQGSPSGNQRMNYSPTSTRAAAPLTDSLGAQHQLNSLTRSYEAPAVSPQRLTPPTTPASSLSGVSAMSALTAPPTVSMGVSMPGLSAPKPVAAAPIQFTPVLPPTRRF